MLGTKAWMQGALKARVKACNSPRILHFATHGFFLEDEKRDPNKEPGARSLFSETLGGGRVIPRRTHISGGPVFGGQVQRARALRVGLRGSPAALWAGANTWLRDGSPPPEAEDGLLNAEDVSGMDLLDTELAASSACDTARGEVTVGEGVFGLRGLLCWRQRKPW